MAAFVDVLITEVYKRPVLWDHKRKDYHNRECVDREWDNISLQLGVNKDMVKLKWKSLRDNFRKEMKKIKQNSGDAAPNRKPKWVHFSTLEFLKDVMETKTTSSNVPDFSQASPVTCEIIHDTDEEAGMSQNIEFAESSISGNETFDELVDPLPPKKRQRRKEIYFQQQLIELEKQKLQWLSQKEEDDDDLYFFKSLIPYMKNLPPTRKLLIRSKIQNIIAEELSTLEDNIEQ